MTLIVLFVVNCLPAVWYVCVGEVVPATRSCSLPNDTPRTTTPLAAIQLPTLPPGASVSSHSETGRQTGDADIGTTAAGRCRTDDHTAPDKKQTPCLLPADNFGLFSVLESQMHTQPEGNVFTL